MPARCALGCQPSGAALHRFPNADKYPEQFKAWVKIEGGRLLSPADFLRYKNKRICDIHFRQEDWNRNNRLNALAVPSLHLPMLCNPRVDEVSQIAVVGEQPQHIETTLEKDTTSELDVLNIMTAESLNPSKYIVDEHNYALRDQLSKIDMVPELPDETSKVTIAETSYVGDDHDYCSRNTSLEMMAGPSAADDTVNEHNYCPKPTSARRGKKTTVPVYATTQLKDAVRQVRNLKREIIRLKKRGLSFKARLENARKISDSIAFHTVSKNMTRAGKIFTKMQQTQSSKKPKGRRFSLEEKILALSYYKRSPKLYPLLSKDFVLPSKKSLKMLLSKIHIKAGINKIIFDKIAKNVKTMNTEDKFCTLIFDEMSISPQINYDAAKDVLKGLSSKKTIADHALVFMVKGIKANFKQPVAYYFTNNLNKIELKKILTQVIESVQATGLQVLTTICDQSTVNVSTINSLIEDTKSEILRKGQEFKYRHFKINKKNIIPLYDVPHLLKGIRNNLLTKDLVYYDEENKKRIIKWEYFEMLYSADKSYGELRVVPKLTEEHVNKDKIKKMKVKTAAQVFSHSVAVATEHLSARGNLPSECRDLIPLVLLLDKLFDSLNSSTFHIPNGKLYKGCVRRNSPHHLLWEKSIKLLKTVKFVTKKNVGDKVRIIECNIPSIENFIKTVEGVQRLWKTLNEIFFIDSLLTRNLNQDPVENFFGNIRSYGCRNVAPDCIAFEGAYKSLLLNNYSTPHSIQGNCEEDNNDCLETLDFFLTENLSPNVLHNNEEVIINNEIMYDNEVVTDKGQSTYVCGWVLTKCLKNVVKGCLRCKADLVTRTPSDSIADELIRRKEYHENKKLLCYPNENVTRVFQDIQKLTCNFLKRDVPECGLRNKLKMLCEIFITYPFTCSRHKEKLKAHFEDVTIKIIIYSWCRSINRILTGKIRYCENDDELKLAAQAYFNKHKTHKLK